ncbi:zinc finger protein AEBP2 isoform X1 [Mustelus asterias]
MAAAAAPSLSAVANDSPSPPAAKSCRSEAKCGGGRSQAGRQQQQQLRRREEEEESEPVAGSGPQASAVPPSGGGGRAPATQSSGGARGLQQQQAARSGLRGSQQQRDREEVAAPAAGNRRQSLENSSDGEPLSRMDSEDRWMLPCTLLKILLFLQSISSTLMDMDSTISSGRSTPALINGHGSTASSGKNITYNCCWDQCHTSFSSSPDLADHIRSIHVDGQRGGVYVCLWKGCKVYNTPSTSQSWLQRHMLTHSGDKPFKCVVGGCTASFASQGGLARHVPTHFSQQNSAKVTSQPKVKEESPSKAVMNKRRRLKNKRRRSLPRPHDFFDAQTMDAIRHRAICFNLSTHIESHGNGHSVVFHSTVIARRREDSGKVKVLLHWTPEDILPDVWVNENDRSQLRTKAVHLSKLPQDAALLLDPNIYRPTGSIQHYEHGSMVDT